MSNSDDENRTKFDGFVNNVADGSYADQLSDADRLANLIARRVENILAPQEALLADIDNKAARCAQMMKLVYRDKTVDVQKAQQAIATTLRTMNERIQSTGDSNNKSDKACRDNFNRMVTNGRLFTDKVVYDVSHRPAGSDEVNLHKDMDYLLACIKHYGKIDPKVFILDKAKMAYARPDTYILHPLPRVNEISTEVDDDPRAQYFQQAKNGMYVRMALILKLLGIY